MALIAAAGISTMTRCIVRPIGVPRAAVNIAYEASSKTAIVIVPPRSSASELYPGSGFGQMAMDGLPDWQASKLRIKQNNG
jgi:hypothetical protein